MSSNTRIEAALVVGGTGFLGYHLVQHLLEDDHTGMVAVLDRNVTKNTHERAKYVECDITNADFIRQIISEIKPSVVFHCASPIAALPAWREPEFYDTNVKGTDILLSLAAESDFVRAFVFTSSMDVYADPPHTNADETFPLWPESDQSNEYNRTKAMGDRIVRQENGSKLKTVVLRPGHAYGERQVQGMIEAVNMAAGNGPLIQIGNGKNMVEVISAKNFAIAHTLQPKRFSVLIEQQEKLMEKLSIFLTVDQSRSGVTSVAYGKHLGKAKPPVELRRMSVEYCLYDHTHSIQKARERLLFDPKSDYDTAVAGAVRWMLDNQEGAVKKDK